MVPAVMKGTLIGLDLSNGMLQRAAALRDSNHLSGVILARGDATRLPLLDACVDRILCFNGLHVMPDKAMVLDEFFRVDGVSKWDKQSRILRMFRKEGGIRMLRDTLKAGWVLGRPLHR